MKYQAPRQYSKHDVESAIAADNVTGLIQMVISVSMYSDDSLWAESVCLRLAKHADWNLRGNAILGFGHIARAHENIASTEVKLLVERALLDEEEYVRGQANAAADDLEQFLGWELEGNG